MPRDRVFVAGVHRVGGRVELAPDDARKLVLVLRRQTGDRVQVVDAAGTSFAARLDVTGKLVQAVLETQTGQDTTETRVRIVVAQAIPKGQKMDFIVEKVTELGAAGIVPLVTSHVAGEPRDHKRDRWQRIARSAAAQAGRSRVPSVEPVADWESLRATFDSYDRIYLAWEGAEPRPLRERFEGDAPDAKALLIVIGPEGGFSVDEVRQAQAAGAVVISLGVRVLRTETAALAVLAALLYARGEL